MADPKIGNWVAETTNTVGTNDVQLTGPIAGFIPFSIMGDGLVYYTIQEGFDKEIGIGTLDSATSVLKRTTVLATLVNNKYSTNGHPMNLKGYAEVFCTISEDFVNKVYKALSDGATNLSTLNQLVQQMKAKLDTIEENAKDDQDASEVPTDQTTNADLPNNVQAALDALWSRPAPTGGFTNAFLLGSYPLQGTDTSTVPDVGKFIANGNVQNDGTISAGSTTSLNINLGKYGESKAGLFSGLYSQKFVVGIVNRVDDQVQYYASTVFYQLGDYGVSIRKMDNNDLIIYLSFDEQFNSGDGGSLQIKPDSEYDIYIFLFPEASRGIPISAVGQAKWSIRQSRYSPSRGRIVFDQSDLANVTSIKISEEDPNYNNFGPLLKKLIKSGTKLVFEADSGDAYFCDVTSVVEEGTSSKYLNLGVSYDSDTTASTYRDLTGYLNVLPSIGGGGSAPTYPVFGDYHIESSKTDAKKPGGAWNNLNRNFYLNYENAAGVDVSKEAKAMLQGQRRKIYLDVIKGTQNYHIPCDGMFFDDANKLMNFDLAVGVRMPGSGDNITIGVSTGEPTLPELGKAYARIRESGESDKLIAIDQNQNSTPFWLGYFTARTETSGSTSNYTASFGYTDSRLAPGSKFRLSTKAANSKSFSAGIIGMQGQAFTLVIASESGYDWRMVDAVFDDAQSMSMPGFTISAYTGEGSNSSNWEIQANEMYQIALIPKSALSNGGTPQIPESDYKMTIGQGSAADAKIIGYHAAKTIGALSPNTWNDGSGSTIAELYLSDGLVAGGDNRIHLKSSAGSKWQNKDTIFLTVAGRKSRLYWDSNQSEYSAGGGDAVDIGHYLKGNISATNVAVSIQADK